MIDRNTYILVKNKNEHDSIISFLKSCGEVYDNVGVSSNLPIINYPEIYMTLTINEYVYIYYIIDYWSWCYCIKPINQINASKFIRQKKLERILK